MSINFPTITRDSKLFPIILAIFAALPPLAVNIYAPAIPLIAVDFGITNSAVLTTFTTYFIGFSVGMLFWGAISDKYGRKRVIIAGTIVYVISSILCSQSTSFTMLEWLRLVQGLSDSVGGVIAFSIARDCYKGAKLMSMVATIVSIMLIAPIVAPIIGTILTVLTGTWQSSFHFLSFYGIILLIASFLIEETLNKEDRQTSIVKIIPSYFAHLKNLKFILATFISGTIFASLFIYISSASIIYLENYNTGPTLYCIYYAVAVIASILGNILIRKLSHRIIDLQYIEFTILAVSIACIILILVNMSRFDNAFIYTVIMGILCLCVSFASSILYSYSMNNIENNFGTATSISNFIKNMIGGFSSFVISYFHGAELLKIIPISQLVFIIFAAILILILVKTKFNPIL